VKRLLVTGSRHWTDRNVILDALTKARDAWLIHGVTLVHGDAREQTGSPPTWRPSGLGGPGPLSRTR